MGWDCKISQFQGGQVVKERLYLYQLASGFAAWSSHSAVNAPFEY